MREEEDRVLQFILGMLNNSSLLVFGVFVSSAILSIPFVDFTSILSNGLENAIHAVSKLGTNKERSINLDLRMYGDKLLLSIKNPYEDEIDMLDGIPQAKEKGHGFGSQSIKYVTEKLKGNCQFIAKDGEFALRVVL
ncbi:hypothetical protein N3C_1466 [Clostridium sp. N3C]|nr:hypothetical protein N3C_1466 [Clostridium sp. N3C]